MCTLVISQPEREYLFIEELVRKSRVDHRRVDLDWKSRLEYKEYSWKESSLGKQNRID